MSCSPLFLIFFISLLSTLHANCQRHSCNQCSTCRRQSLFAQLEICTDSLTFLSNYLSLSPTPQNLTSDCSFSKCYPIVRPKLCNLLSFPLPSSTQLALDQLSAAHQRKLLEFNQLKNKRTELTRTSLKTTGLSNYHQRLQPLVESITALREDALRVRQYHDSLVSFLKSSKYREQRLRVGRYKLQGKRMMERYTMWRRQKRRIRRAVAMSAGAVKRERMVMSRTLTDLEQDVDLLRQITLEAEGKDKQVKLAQQVKEQLESRLQSLTEWVKIRKSELALVDEAKQELVSLLTEVLTQLKQGTGGLKCGGGALGAVVAQAVEETQ